MQYLVGFFTILLALVLLSADVVMAQTETPASSVLSRRMLRQQDRQECTTQAMQQGIAKRNRAEVVRKCMADRQGARKAAAKKKALEEKGGKPAMRARVHKWTRERIATAKKRWAEDQEKFGDCQRRLAEVRKTKHLSVYRQVDFLEHCMIKKP